MQGAVQVDRGSTEGQEGRLGTGGVAWARSSTLYSGVVLGTTSTFEYEYVRLRVKLQPVPEAASPCAAVRTRGRISLGARP